MSFSSTSFRLLPFYVASPKDYLMDISPLALIDHALRRKPLIFFFVFWILESFLILTVKTRCKKEHTPTTPSVAREVTD
jgi:hypothetical protein